METSSMSRITKHAMLQRHMASYDKLLQYAISRFSCRRLHDRLSALRNMISHTGHSLSMQDFRQTLRDISSSPDSPAGEEEGSPTQIKRYFDAFFEDVQFLRELKRYFDQRIHRYLYEYYYDPTDDLDHEEEDLDFEASTGSAFLTSDLGSGSRIQQASNQQRLSNTVRELYSLCAKWDNLLSQDELDTHNFSVESEMEISTFPSVYPLENILRLMPDLFFKSFRALELAQIWRSEACSVYGENLAISASTKDITMKQEVLRERILSLTLEISEAEETLQEEYEELRTLKAKEGRHLKLDEDFKMVETMRRNSEEKVTELLKQREELQNRSSLVRDEKQHWQHIERKLLAAEGDLHVLDFRLNLLKEDYDLEVLFLPDIVRFVVEVEQRVEALEKCLQEKRAERDTTEKTIASIKRNCIKMRDIVDKYYKHRYSSGVSVETNEAGDTLSTCTSTEEGMSEDGMGELDQHELMSSYTTNRTTSTPAATTPHYATPTRTTPNYATPTRATPHYGTPTRTTPYYATPTPTTPINTTPTRTAPHYATPTRTAPHYATPTPTTHHYTMSTGTSPLYTTPTPTTPHSTTSNVTTPQKEILARDSVSQSSGILKHSARSGSLSASPCSRGESVSREGKESQLSENARTKTVRWKSPPVSDESDEES